MTSVGIRHGAGNCGRPTVAISGAERVGSITGTGNRPISSAKRERILRRINLPKLNLFAAMSWRWSWNHRLRPGKWRDHC